MMTTLIQKMSEIVGVTSMVSRCSMARRARKSALQVRRKSKRIVPRKWENQSSTRYHTLLRKRRMMMTLIYWLSLSKVLIVSLSKITQTSYKTTRSSKREKVNKVSKLLERRGRDLEQMIKGHGKTIRDQGNPLTPGMLLLEKVVMRGLGKP